MYVLVLTLNLQYNVDNQLEVIEMNTLDSAIKEAKSKTKSRKQGNSLSLTIPVEFGLTEGVAVQPKLFKNGIFYEFVEPAKDDFFNFDNDILKDIIADDTIPREEILHIFMKRKTQIPGIFKDFADEAVQTAKPMSKDEMEKFVGL